MQGRVQSKRASEREPGPEDLDRIEGEFRIKAALNVAGLSKAMLLAREQEIFQSGSRRRRGAAGGIEPGEVGVSRAFVHASMNASGVVRDNK